MVELVKIRVIEKYAVIRVLPIGRLKVAV